MARSLTPQDYGLVTLVGSGSGIISALGDLGLGRAMVQFRDEPSHVTEDTALVVSGLVGVTSFAVSVASGWYLAHKYSRPAMIPIGAIMGLNIFLNSIYVFQMNCLNRDLKFAAESRQNLIFAGATAGTGISLALAGLGPFALVLQALVAQIISIVAIHPLRSLRWPVASNMSTAHRLLKYGLSVTLAQYVNGVQQPLINLAIAGIVGDSMLAVFGRASQVRDLVAQNLMSSADRLLYPLMRQDKENQQRIQWLFMRGMVALSVLCTFAWAWFTADSHELVRIVLGSQWGAVPELLTVLSYPLLFTGIGLMSFTVTHAFGMPFVWMRYSLLGFAMLIPAVTIGAQTGIVGIASGIAVAQILGMLAFSHWAIRATNLAVRTVLRSLWPIAASALLSFWCMSSIRRMMTTGALSIRWLDPVAGPLASPILVLTATTLTGIAAYTAVLYILRPSILTTLTDLVLGREANAATQ